MPRRTALVLLNSQARNGSRRTDFIDEVLADHGLKAIIIRLKPGVDASAVIDEYAARVDRVIIGGGDGTLNAAARGLIAHKLPLGILPLGTANDLARTLGIPTDVHQALNLILLGHTQMIDVGEVNGKPFFNVASVGFSAELAKNLTKQAKARWGVLGYALTACKLLMKIRPFRATLAYAGREDYVKTLQVAVGNGHYYGGGMKVATDARPDDGALDVYSLELAYMAELFALLPMLKTGTHAAWPTVRGLRVPEFELYTTRPMDVNADGEIVTQTPAIFKVRAQAVKVFIPS